MEIQTEPFAVISMDGSRVDIRKEYGGRPLLVVFFNIHCLGCVGRALPLAYAFDREFKNLDVVAVHTSFTEEEVTRDEIVNLFTSRELPFPIYFDEGRSNYDRFGCEGTPHWLLMDGEGRVNRSLFGSQDGAQTRLSYALEELTKEPV